MMVAKRFRLVLLLCLAAVLGACGKSSPTSPQSAAGSAAGSAVEFDHWDALTAVHAIGIVVNHGSHYAYEVRVFMHGNPKPQPLLPVRQVSPSEVPNNDNGSNSSWSGPVQTEPRHLAPGERGVFTTPGLSWDGTMSMYSYPIVDSIRCTVGSTQPER